MTWAARFRVFGAGAQSGKRYFLRRNRLQTANDDRPLPGSRTGRGTRKNVGGEAASTTGETSWSAQRAERFNGAIRSRPHRSLCRGVSPKKSSVLGQHRKTASPPRRTSMGWPGVPFTPAVRSRDAAGRGSTSTLCSVEIGKRASAQYIERRNEAPRRKLQVGPGAVSICCPRRSDRRQSIRGTSVIATNRRDEYRVLMMEELALVWRWAARAPYPWGPFLQLLMLTGARRNEWACAKQAWLIADRSRLEIPSMNNKSGKTQVLPLSRQAREILHTLPEQNLGPYLFSSCGGDRPISEIQ